MPFLLKEAALKVWGHQPLLGQGRINNWEVSPICDPSARTLKHPFLTEVPNWITRSVLRECPSKCWIRMPATYKQGGWNLSSAGLKSHFLGSCSIIWMLSFPLVSKALYHDLIMLQNAASKWSPLHFITSCTVLRRYLWLYYVVYRPLQKQR